jgi:hypothetical protein
MTAASAAPVRRDTARSVVIKTVGGREREMACGEILAAAARPGAWGAENWFLAAGAAV